jgi:hypothetical protein
MFSIIKFIRKNLFCRLGKHDYYFVSGSSQFFENKHWTQNRYKCSWCDKEIMKEEGKKISRKYIMEKEGYDVR